MKLFFLILPKIIHTRSGIYGRVQKNFTRALNPTEFGLPPNVNKQALKGIEKGMLEQGMPYGSIIVKENYSADAELINVTSMYKKKGFNPQAGDWLWIVHTPGKEIDNAGKIGMCIDCHSQVEHRDYLFIDAHE
ncbi:MAG: cytochrome P460 family protein [Desulfonatronovibrio sp.]